MAIPIETETTTPRNIIFFNLDIRPFIGSPKPSSEALIIS